MTKKIQEMSAAQMSKREDIVKSMKKNFADFRKRYGDQAKSVMYATATKQAMGEEQETDEEEFYSEHMCAQHVYHDVYGEGVVLEGEHDVPDADGEIAWYTVEFAHGKETVYTEDVMIMAERYHGHMMKKKKMKEEVEQIDEIGDTPAGKKTLGNYLKKRTKQLPGIETNYQMTPYEDGPMGAKTIKKFQKKVNKGMNRAIDRLTKEEVEEVDEALVGNQHKIDMNKNNRIDAHDFKLLRKIKKTRNQ